MNWSNKRILVDGRDWRVGIMGQIYLRKVEAKDSGLLFEWANEETVRNNSINTHIIKLEEHRIWFLDRLNRTDSDMFILMMDDKPVGQIRLDYKDSCAWISFSVDKQYRGHGYGGIMLRLAEEEVRRRKQDICSMAGVVKKENIASQKNFIKLYYKSIEDSGDMNLILFQKKLY